MVTDEELKQIMTRLTTKKREEYLPFLVKAMEEFEIDRLLREAAFLAQLAHESVELRFMEEIWGPTKAQIGYEGRHDLGNTEPGDGKRFKGRGPIQLTGRANYKKFGNLLKVDLIANPQFAATKEVGFRIAGLYWQLHGLNAFADQGDFKTITRKINGGLNGFNDRLMYYNRAQLVLAKSDRATGENVDKPARILVDGKEIPTAKGILRDDHVLAALRPVATAAGWLIVEVSQGKATIRDRSGANHQVPLVIEGGVGFAALRDLPGTTAWDPDSATASLATA
jgi:predicted chitinase